MEYEENKPLDLETTENDLKIIDWDEVFLQVGGDKEFLLEILEDFKQEISIAEHDIEIGISINDLPIILKTSHRVKGSAAYLYCEKIHDISLKIQNTATIDEYISKEDESKKIETISGLFEKFCLYKKELITEINNYLYK